MYGWMGKILRIDLTEHSYEIEDLDEDLAKEYMGGRGLATKILYDEIDPEIDAFDPDNKMIFATGPLTGTGAIGSSRFVVVTKSPLGNIGNGNAGGAFGPEIKFAGYDVIILEGKSPDPIYLWIEDDKIEFKPAEDLWGKTAHETEDQIKSQLAKESWKKRGVHVACIGPAGENLVKVAAIIVDKHNAAARGGIGAVMGSKNLKAIAIRGHKSIPIADPKAFKEVVSTLLDKVKDTPFTKNFFANGSSGILHIYNEVGMLATRNFQTGVFEKAEDIDAHLITEKHLVRNRACFSCPMACGGMTHVKDGPFAGRAERPDFETTWVFGADSGCNSIEAILKANNLCNDLGMDTISLGSTIAAAMEMFEKGYITEKDVGFSLKFGDAEAMVKLVEMTAYRKGFGDDVAEGGYHLTNKYGHPELFIGVKKLENPAYDPRACQGIGLNLATAARGACHNKGYTMISEILGDAVKIIPKTDPFATEGKAQLTKDLQDDSCIFDNAGICLFLLVNLWTKEILEQLEPATGAGYTMESMKLVGERTWNIERLFNQKAGLTGKDDTLPKRLLEEPMPEGPAKGRVCKLDEMLPEYYKLRGWDENGVPTEEKLNELGLD
ncbi:MAG: aldehyde ferredoxin oxidoreductase [Deltaproteobacteria bacterium]|nr:aldehyde ferredoxin oxidoreductase [Deltaproteobacteria bacterium]